jgi:hypothetical protein
VTNPVATDRLSHQLYRQEALERLMAAEQWDQRLSLARPKGWVTGLGLALLVAVAGLWGIWGSVAQTASAQGTVVRTTSSGASLDLVVRLPPSEAASIHSGMIARVVPVSGGSIANPWDGVVRSVSVVASGWPAPTAVRGTARFGKAVRLSLRSAAAPVRETGFLAPGVRCTVTITTGKHSPFRAFIR